MAVYYIIFIGEWSSDQWHGKGSLKFAGGGKYTGGENDPSQFVM
jgi:hypothetical protein